MEKYQVSMFLIFPTFILYSIFSLSVSEKLIIKNITDKKAINSGKILVNSNVYHNTPIACEDCAYIIKPNQYLVDNAELKLPAGSIIGIKGQNRKGIYIKNFHGTDIKPFLFINCDGLTTVTSGVVGIKIHESSHIHVTGTGSADEYGIKIFTKLHGVAAEHGTTDFEIDHVEISGSESIGFIARSDPDAGTNRKKFIQKNTLIHHNYVHNVGNEGFYIGGSHWHSTLDGFQEPELVGVRVYNNRVEDTGYDGIQVGSAIKDAEIYNNTIVNYGLKNSTYHQSGLQANPGTTAKIYNNYIRGGTGNAIFLSGFDNSVYNNLIIDCTKYGVYIKDMEPHTNKSYRIFNNTLINIELAAVKTTSTQSVDNIFYNNVLINTGGGVDKTSNMDFDIANNFEASTISDALFADPDKLDFSPLQNSPLVDRGLDISDTANLHIEGDYLFNNRKSGKAIDIGAFEYQNN